MDSWHGIKVIKLAKEGIPNSPNPRHASVGLDSQLDPVECADEGCGGKEVAGEFVIAGSDAPPVFDAAEVIFDFVAASIKAFGTIGCR